MHAQTSGYTVAGDDVRGQLEELRQSHPELHALADPQRLAAWEDALCTTLERHDDFGADPEGSRGVEYVQAQTLNSRARETGIRNLLGFADSASRVPNGERPVLVDLLGGDGLVRKVCEELGIGDFNILTCDASPHMVASAWAAGMPALLQRAEQPLLRDRTVDAVLLAYGSHHVPPSDRQTVATEAHRMLRPGGAFILHDFLVGSPVDVWFEEVTDVYSATGHKFLHFTRDEIDGYLEKAGYDHREVVEIDDPYTAVGATPEEAEIEIGRYLLNMYGLVKVFDGRTENEAYRWVTETAKSIFRYPDGEGSLAAAELRYEEGTGKWRLTIPRRAVVGVGRIASAATPDGR
ncbi:class I SAM-dependent methyltransferase [Streptomyces turgidiscabies]|uniref:SAM-dependent methyltransferase n=1 Tax=Streptomyces turgidiscabies TaxID=85558 RepID=A0ABU0RZW1_9ACTN|nr:class I SAM-dependent methyltransferase [Streptomyces turgidiscabies]MDQ0937541.1 SAM-dependent methyltransferase [Streptomyces turgidiscabies]